MARALGSDVRLREVWAWSMYDFANSAYTTVVITAVFGAYFVGGVAGNAPWATFAWTAALSVSYAAILFMFTSIGLTVLLARGAGSDHSILSGHSTTQSAPANTK